jgi:hypothetical protein
MDFLAQVNHTGEPVALLRKTPELSTHLTSLPGHQLCIGAAGRKWGCSPDCRNKRERRKQNGISKA